jgi:hypothetical protein
MRNARARLLRSPAYRAPIVLDFVLFGHADARTVLGATVFEIV